MASRIAAPVAGQLERMVIEKCRNGKLQMEEAVSLFHHILRVPNPSVYSLNSLLVSISKMNHPNRYPTVISLFNRLNQARNVGVFPSIHTFGVTINCCCRMERTDLGFIVLGQLFRAGYIVNSIIFGSLLKGLCIKRRIGDAAKLFDKMPLMGCSPNLIMYNTLIDGLCSNGNTKLGLRIYEEMERDGQNCEPDVVTYNTLINGLCKEGDVSMAIKMLDKMVSKGVAPDVLTYNTLIDGLCKSSDLDGAFKWFENMIAKGIAPDVLTYNTLIDGLCKSGDLDGAFKWFEEMVFKGVAPNVLTYTIIIDGLCKSSDLDGAFKWFEEMIAKGIAPDVLTYTTLIDGLCKSGDLVREGNMDKAFELFNKMIRLGLAPNVFTMADQGIPLSEVSKNILIEGVANWKGDGNIAEFVKSLDIANSSS
ncbi:hypothetical protein LUZ60_014274 [Juncus effusus]|nr:hypothetical protein LUZ60_014274 [Juncus effusus]